MNQWSVVVLSTGPRRAALGIPALHPLFLLGACALFPPRTCVQAPGELAFFVLFTSVSVAGMINGGRKNKRQFGP